MTRIIRRLPWLQGLLGTEAGPVQYSDVLDGPATPVVDIFGTGPIQTLISHHTGATALAGNQVLDWVVLETGEQFGIQPGALSVLLPAGFWYRFRVIHAVVNTAGSWELALVLPTRNPATGINLACAALPTSAGALGVSANSLWDRGAGNQNIPVRSLENVVKAGWWPGPIQVQATAVVGGGVMATYWLAQRCPRGAEATP